MKRNNARLVDKSYSQQLGIDYIETFASVVQLDTTQNLIAMAAQRNWLIHQLGVKSAFLIGELEEDIYVEKPQGFVVNKEKYNVNKILYA